MDPVIKKKVSKGLLLLAALYSGCTLGPNYLRPEVEKPMAFRFQEREAQDLANTEWWQQFKDPVLNELIEEALANNKDLRIAAARVEEFAGRLTTTRAELFPQIGYEGSAGRLRVPELGPAPLPPGFENPRDTYQAIFSATWEIDVWGRIRRLSEAARAELLASEEGRRTVVLTLVASVANGYINLRNLDKQLEISKSTAKAYGETLKLFELRFQGGVVSEVELAQIRSQHEQAQARIPFFENLVAQQENALSILLGRNPAPIPRGNSLDALVLPAVPSGLPSELLERRPDLLAAEQQLVAANARIGAARALYFPTISLTGLFGSASSDLSDLFTGPAEIWSYAGRFAGPIFTAGAISGTVAQAEAQQEQALHTFTQAIQTAFREVEDALIDQRKSREQVEALGRQVEALRRYAKLARIRFENGETSYLEVLDAERSLFDAELDYAQTQGNVFQALADVYKAMGGGWVTEADKLTSPGAVAQGETASETPAAASGPQTE